MSEIQGVHAAEILLVEADPDDIDMMKQAFQEIAAPHRLHVVRTGSEALLFFRHEDPFAGATRPDLVLLDLPLPDMPGLDVLAHLKSHPSWRRVPVLVISGAHDRAEVAKAYHLNANSYIPKPVGPADFVRVVKGVEDFWLTVVKLPRD